MTAIFILLGVMAMCQSHPRRAVAIIYAAGILVHAVFFRDIDGEWYYITAAMIDMFCVAIMAEMPYRTELIDRLMDVCLLSASINFLGFLTWFFYDPPDAYNVAMAAIYLAAGYNLLRGDKNGGVGAFGFWRDIIHRHHRIYSDNDGKSAAEGLN